MKKRYALKKGKIVTTRSGNFVRNLAMSIVREIRPYCKKIRIAGSIRRKEKNPIDIDIVLIPKNKEKIKGVIRTKGDFIEGGKRKASFLVKDVKVELYYTVPEEFGACLLAYSSKTGASIGLRVFAKKKGFRLNQHGLFRKGKFVAGKREEDIYKALGKSWKKPEER